MADEIDATRPRRTKSIIIVLIAILAGGGFIWWLTHRAPSDATGGGAPGASGGGGGGGGRGGRRPPATVGIAKVTAQDVPLTLDALGTVTPAVTATVRTRINGTLDKVLFREGQTVSAGQLLAEVDPRPYKLAVEQAQGVLARDTAQAKQAQVDLSRYQTLLQQDSIARQQVDTQRALVGQLGGTIATDKAALDAAKLNLAYTRIVAPVSGQVGLRQVDVGNYVTTGDSNGVVILTQVRPIDVQFTLPEAQLPQVVAGVRKSGHLPVQALDRDAGKVLANGIFSTFDNRVDTTSGTVKAKARFSNADGALFPNQFVNIRLTYDTLQQALVVPITSIRNGPKGQFVYIAHLDTRTAELRNIQSGPTANGMVAITQGVKAGETVVTEGADRLTDGGKIVLPGDKRGGPGGAGGPGGWKGRGGGQGGGQGGASGAPGGGQGHHRHSQDASASQ